MDESYVLGEVLGRNAASQFIVSPIPNTLLGEPCICITLHSREAVNPHSSTGVFGHIPGLGFGKPRASGPHVLDVRLPASERISWHLFDLFCLWVA